MNRPVSSILKGMACPLLTLLLFLAACGSKQSTGTHISGEIKGLPDSSVIYIYGADRLYKHTDTLTTGKGGKFEADLRADTLAALWMLFDDGTQYPLFADKQSKLRIKGTADSLAQTLSVTGSLPNDELAAFLHEVRILEQPTETTLQQMADTFITTHPNSLASLYVLERYFILQPDPDMERIERLIKGLSGELKDRPLVMRLEAQLKDREQGRIGKNAPYFRLPDADKKLKSRNDFKDQYILLHFWASWDAASRTQNKELLRLSRDRKKDKAFALLGISLDVEREEWQKAVKADTLEWEQLCDFAGWNTEAVRQFAVIQLPCTFLISPEGKIIGRDMDIDAVGPKVDAEKEREEKAKAAKEKAERERKAAAGRFKKK